jgi:hypothetical protein
MNQTLAVTKIEAVEEIGPGIFQVQVTARGCLNSDPSHEWFHTVTPRRYGFPVRYSLE